MILGFLFFACQKEELIAKETYDTYCGLCHGYEGEGYLAPQANALSNPEFLAASTDEFLRYAIVYGRPSTKMSPWGEEVGGPLNEKDVDRIIAHMRTWDTLPQADIHDVVVEGNVENGEVLYIEHCAYCHGDEGEGTSALSLNNTTFLESVSDGFLLHALEEGRSGTAMISYSQTLTESELFDLVTFIRSFEE
jgi:cytochrome c oxidase cbb3-type subunit 3